MRSMPVGPNLSRSGPEFQERSLQKVVFVLNKGQLRQLNLQLKTEN